MDSGAVLPFWLKAPNGEKTLAHILRSWPGISGKVLRSSPDTALVEAPPLQMWRQWWAELETSWARVKKLGFIVTTLRSEMFFRYNLKPTAEQSYKCYNYKSTVALLIMYYLLNISWKFKEKIPPFPCDTVGIGYRMLLLFKAVQDLWACRCSEPMQRESCFAAMQKRGNSHMALWSEGIRTPWPAHQNLTAVPLLPPLHSGIWWSSG